MLCNTYVNVCIASRLGRRPKRLKEMQLAIAAAVGGGNMSTHNCSSVTDQHLETSSAAMRHPSMSSLTINGSLDVTDVHAELQVHSCVAVLHVYCISFLLHNTMLAQYMLPPCVRPSVRVLPKRLNVGKCNQRHTIVEGL